MAKKKLYQPHYSTATDLRVVQTRDAISATFLELLNCKPLEQITIREIAATAGIGYNTFFRHYNGKEELLSAIAADEIKALTTLSCEVLDSTNTRKACLAVFHYVAERDALWATLLTGGAASILREEFIRCSRERAREVAIRKHKNADSLPEEIGIKLTAVGTIELLTIWLEQSERVAAEVMADIYEKLVIAPVMNAYASQYGINIGNRESKTRK